MRCSCRKAVIGFARAARAAPMFKPPAMRIGFRSRAMTTMACDPAIFDDVSASSAA
jgi:hypothetical protein